MASVNQLPTDTVSDFEGLIQEGAVETDVEWSDVIGINTQRALVGNEELHDKLGLDGFVVAKIDANNQSFLLVDVQRYTGSRASATEANTWNADYLLISPKFDARNSDSAVGYKGIRAGEEEVVVDGHAERFGYDPKVEPVRVAIKFDKNRGLQIRGIFANEPVKVFTAVEPETLYSHKQHSISVVKRIEP